MPTRGTESRREKDITRLKRMGKNNHVDINQEVQRDRNAGTERELARRYGPGVFFLPT